jgi:Inner membrane protein YgaP-like, transmembrane domain
MKLEAESDETPQVVFAATAVRIMAGVMVLLSLALAHWVNQWWLLLTVFVGVNLIQSALIGFCLLPG